MAVKVFVERLRVMEVASVGVDAVEEAIGRVVAAGAVVVLLDGTVVLLAGVQVIGLDAVGRVGCAAQHDAIGVVAVALLDGLIQSGKLPRRAVAVVEEVLRAPCRPDTARICRGISSLIFTFQRAMLLFLYCFN